jgi:hypothetical protein
LKRSFKPEIRGHVPLVHILEEERLESEIEGKLDNGVVFIT